MNRYKKQALYGRRSIHMSSVIRELFGIKKKAIDNFKRHADYQLPGKDHIDSTRTLIYHENDPEGYKKARSFLCIGRMNLPLRYLLMILKLSCFRHSILVENSPDRNGNLSGFKGTVCTIGMARGFGRIFDFRLDYMNIIFLCCSARLWSRRGVDIRLRAYFWYRRFLKNIKTCTRSPSHG